MQPPKSTPVHVVHVVSPVVEDVTSPILTTTSDETDDAHYCYNTEVNGNERVCLLPLRVEAIIFTKLFIVRRANFC